MEDEREEPVDAQDAVSAPMRLETVGETPQDEVSRARMLLAAHDQERIKACDRELREVLDRHGMALEAVGVLNLRPSGQ